MQNNICRFPASNTVGNEINIINFVYEKERKNNSFMHYDSTYRMHLAVNGSAKIQILGNSFDIKKGDIFFTFPSSSYNIDGYKDFEYMYISYIGIRANSIMDKLGITCSNFVFAEFSELIRIWKESVTAEGTVTDLMCEGLLLYSLSMLGDKILKESKAADSIIKQIKKYIDDNFCDSTLSLDKISAEFMYNKKYISGYYKKVFRIGISQYITTLRIQKACALIDNGFTSVKDIAFQCGFSDPLYFSSVFKKKIGISPRTYIQEL